MTMIDDSVLRAVTYNPDERVSILRSLSVAERSAVFAELSPYVQQLVLKQLKINDVVEILDHLDLQQTKRILSRIKNTKKRDEIVQRLKGEVREKVDYFLRFHPKATMSLMNFNYLFLPVDTTIGDAGVKIEEHYQETGRYPEILLHDKGVLVGEVPFATLVKERNSYTLERYVVKLPTITYQAEITEIIGVLTSTKSKKVVILDNDGSVLGLIYADAARTLFSDLPAESLYDFAGVDISERPFDDVRKKVINRYRWLILNLATSFLAGSVVLVFQKTLDAITILSVYIPIMAGMGGNAASQAFAITLRGITLGTISMKNAWPAILNEGMAGAVNGIIIGLVVTIISLFWGGGLTIGLLVGLALVCSHFIAPMAGMFVPLFLKSIGIDPATTSNIFITTVTDVSGLLFLFGFATLLLL